jgi:hypothetical protein
MSAPAPSTGPGPGPGPSADISSMAARLAALQGPQPAVVPLSEMERRLAVRLGLSAVAWLRLTYALAGAGGPSQSRRTPHGSQGGLCSKFIRMIHVEGCVAQAGVWEEQRCLRFVPCFPTQALKPPEPAPQSVEEMHARLAALRVRRVFAWCDLRIVCCTCWLGAPPVRVCVRPCSPSRVAPSASGGRCEPCRLVLRADGRGFAGLRACGHGNVWRVHRLMHSASAPPSACKLLM